MESSDCSVYSTLCIAERPLKSDVQMDVADSLQEVWEGNSTTQWRFSCLDPLPVISVSE